MKSRLVIIVTATVLLFSSDLCAADDAGKPHRKLQGGSTFAASDSTNIDFSETLIDGKMQAPQGFFLQGRKAQTLTQMVRLRSKWRSELRNSRSAVKAIVK